MQENNAPFHIGQQVVAVESGLDIEKGQEYTVLGLRLVCCSWLVDVGIKVPYEADMRCFKCKYIEAVQKGSIWWVDHKLFAPIETRKVEIAEEILNSIQITEEVPDKALKPETVNN